MNLAELDAARQGLLVGLLLGVPMYYAFVEACREARRWWRELDRNRFLHCRKDWK